jgi:CO/xanthine dehydrogenase FAD-binding subunit
MTETKWYFPENMGKVPKLLNKALPHGGGTFILKMNMDRIHGLIDLSGLDLKYSRIDGGIIRIGSMQTFSGVVNFMREIDQGHILVKALQTSASESLRNRITVGGSVASFPAWSDIMGPLLSLEATVSLIGKTEGHYPIRDYIENHSIRKESLITEVSFHNDVWVSSYYRETRTQFDHAMYTITLLAKIIGDRVGDCKIVVTGTKNRFTDLSSVSDSLKNKPFRELNIEEITRSLTFEFPRRQSLSSEYINHLARTQLERRLKEVFRR